MYASVALLGLPYATFSYTLPPEFSDTFWKSGLRVAVPLGRGQQAALRAAVLLDTCSESDIPDGVAQKELCWPLESAPLISRDLLALACDLSRRQGLFPGQVLGHVLPHGLRQTRVRLHLIESGQAEVWTLQQLRDAPSGERARLAQALCDQKARILPVASDPASSEVCLLTQDPPWPVRPSAKRQIQMLDHLHQHGPSNRRLLLRQLGQSLAPALKSLQAAGLVRLAHAEKEDDFPDDAGQNLLPPPPAPVVLNADQQNALQSLLDFLAADDAASVLLFGVTGSGKTAVYMELAKACMARGQSLLLLAPEVALAHKLRRDAACSLPHAPLFFYHGYQPPARREKIFRQLAERQEACIVVGTRSALFLPVPHLACIVLDEEHDSSFKQEENLPYHAKEVAWFRTLQARGLLVLGSATPDLKTFHAAENGRLPVVHLPQRISGRALPPVELVDIASAAAAAASRESLLAPESEDALRATLTRGEQAIVLLNRRGYAPVMYCLDCHRPARCPHCEIGLTYHKGLEKLVCHYCGFTLPFPSPCGECGSANFLPMGEGTERLAEHLSTLSGGRPVLRLDRDSTRRPGRMEEILASFARGEAPILVGTQMLSKGHHFPEVTLAIIADGDLGLNLPDYRAAERTFQLLVQSSGRAGRGEKPGQVLIQTRDVRHYCWQYVRTADYEGFYRTELERRSRYRYPPFVHLGLLRISHDMHDARGAAALHELAALLRKHAGTLGVQMLGPAPAPLALLRGRRRFACLLKGKHWQAMRDLHLFAQAQKPARSLRLFLDLDPITML